MTKLANTLKALLGLAISGACLQGIVGLQTAKLAQSHSRIQSLDANLIQSETNTINLLQRTPAFGFNNLVSDWAFLRFIQYFGDESGRKKHGYNLIPEYFEVVVRHDPRFVSALLALSPACSLYAGKPARTVNFLAQALKSMTLQDAPKGAFYVWFYKGIDEMLFVGAMKAAQQSYATSALWAKFENSPESRSIGAIAEQTAQFLAQNPDSRHARIGAWASLLGTSTDAKVQAWAQQQIEKLGGKVTIVEQNGAKNIQVSMPQNK